MAKTNNKSSKLSSKDKETAIETPSTEFAFQDPKLVNGKDDIPKNSDVADIKIQNLGERIIELKQEIKASEDRAKEKIGELKTDLKADIARIESNKKFWIGLAAGAALTFLIQMGSSFVKQKLGLENNTEPQAKTYQKPLKNSLPQH